MKPKSVLVKIVMGGLCAPAMPAIRRQMIVLRIALATNLQARASVSSEFKFESEQSKSPD